MRLNLYSLLVSALVAFAQIASFDAGNDVSYAVSIPDATAQSGNGDFYFQIAGPTSFSWLALGFGGDGMVRSSIYVVYAAGDGNLTVSPRLGVGYREPEVNPDATVTLLEGSGISDGRMVANVRCSNCASWDGDSIDFTSSSYNMIHAERSGDALNTQDANADLTRHQRDGQRFTFDLTVATGGDVDTNPFVEAATPTGTTGTDEPVQPTPVTGGNTGSSTEGVSAPSDMLLKAHGIIMGLVVVVLLPLGALLIRLLPVPWWLHGAIQTVLLLLFTAGWAIGYHEAGERGLRFEDAGKTHTIFGTVIFALFWVQPIGGYIHHVLYKKHQRRTAVSHGHIWMGRITFILAIVNGGLGLKLADNTTGGTIAYGVVSGIVGVAYIVLATFGEWRKKKNVQDDRARKEKDGSPTGS